MQDLARWQTLAWALVAGVVVFFGARALWSHGSSGGVAAPVEVRSPPGAASASGGARRGGGGAAAGVFVHVAGAVRRPGLYRVGTGSRVAVAVRRAGGFARGADATGINLAAKLQDGQQVVVPAAGAAGAVPGAAPGGGPAGAGAAAGRKLSLGTATAEQLDELDGIGPGLAEKIVDYRTEHGGFRSLEELQEVSGIGPKRFEALKDGLAP